MSCPFALVALNMGGPDSPDSVELFLRNLFSDPDLIQLGWLRVVQPALARWIAHRRAPRSREAYAQIGGRSPIREESTAQASAVAEAMAARGIPARAYVAMSYWHPLPAETAAAMHGDGLDRAILLPLYPQRSRTTTGSALHAMEVAAARVGIACAKIEGFATAVGYLDAVCDRVRETLQALPAAERDLAPVLFSAHGLPEAYLRAGDPYLDDVRSTVAAVVRRLGLGLRARLAFQSRVGRRRWLGPATDEAIAALANGRCSSLVVVPVSFTGEHVETLQELDILYRARALSVGFKHFVRAGTVGCHPAFVNGLADLAADAARRAGWI